MKQLFAGILFIVVLGLGAFLYRNVTERPAAQIPSGLECTQEAQLCPDGTSVGRTGPSCSFAACAYPNVEVAGLAFAVPAGYAADENAPGANPDFLAAFTKPSSSGNPTHLITIERFPIAEGETAEDVMLANTRFQPADMPAESISELKTESINGKTFYVVSVERFEALIHTHYFLPRATDVIRFSLVEHDVTNWTDPSLIINSLPEQQALRKMLQTLQLK